MLGVTSDEMSWVVKATSGRQINVETISELSVPRYNTLIQYGDFYWKETLSSLLPISYY